MTSVEVADRETDAAESYRSNGFALLKGLFPAAVTRAFHARLQSDLNITQTREFLTSSNLLQKEAIEVYSLQYPPMATFLWGLTPSVSQLAGCDLLPTYAYFRVYQQGDICRVHSDRDACEHSLSLMLELSDDRPWPLCVGWECRENPDFEVNEDFGAEQFTSLPMSAGDGVLYQGVTHRHGRMDPNPNRWSAHLFLHWVDSQGPHSSHAFDRVALANAQGQA